jgi:PAS domain S-box-containing protein
MNAEPDKVKPVLQPMKDRYQFLAENISDVIFTLDLSLNYTYCSPSVERLRGYTAAEVMTQTLEHVLTPASYEIAKKTVEEALAFERTEPGAFVEPRTLELELTRKGGGTVWTEAKVSFLRDEKGEVAGILGVSRDISERRTLEEALRESEEKYRLLFQKSTDPVLLLDGDTYVDCNEATLNFMGCSRHQLVGLHPWDVSPDRQPDGSLSQQKARDLIERALQDGANRFEWLHRTFEGREVWADVAITVVPVGGRKILYTLWRDIGKRKKAEKALLTSQFHLSEAMRLARIVYWELDPETDTFVFNDPFYALYGTTAGREGGYRMDREEYVKRFVHPDDIPLLRKEFEKSRSDRGGEFFNEMEHRIIRRDGSVRHLLARIYISRGDTGLVTRYYGANQDITEQVLTKKALVESEERYRIAIEHSNDGVAIVRGDEHIYVNQRFLSMFGYDDPEEIVGAGAFFTVHPDDRERVMEINRKRQKGEPALSRYEFKGIRKDRTTIHVEVSATRIVYDGKAATLAYLRDITERLRAEEMLRQSQKMEAVGTLSAGIAHDFKNILMAIEGFANLGIKYVQDDSKAKRHLDRICRAVERGKDIVRQILTFSQKGEDEPKPTELIPIIRESIGMLHASLRPTIEIRENFTAESALVLADPTQVQQIIINLVTNAAYAMGQRGGILSIELTDFTPTSQNTPAPWMTVGPYLKLSISDTGAGMDRQTMERVFDPFFTTKKRTEGTGLGLWVVHSIVKKQRGAITVRSTPGEGATFEVFLPRFIC